MTMKSLPEAVLVHCTDHRLRLRIPSQKGNQAYFGALSNSLGDLEGMDKVSVNPTTGSVLILHNLEPKMLIDKLNQKGIFKIRTEDMPKGRLYKQVESFFVDADRRVIEATGGEMNLPMLVFLALGATAIYQIVRGNLSGLPWYTALWYAYSLFKKGNGAPE